MQRKWYYWIELLEIFFTWIFRYRNRSAARRKMAIRAKVTSGNCKTNRNFILSVNSHAFEFDSIFIFFALRFRQFVNKQRYSSAIDRKTRFSTNFIAFGTLECMYSMWIQLGRSELEPKVVTFIGRTLHAVQTTSIENVRFRIAF